MVNMALYMQDPYRKFNYPVHVGKPAALVNAQMSQNVNRATLVRIGTVEELLFTTLQAHFPQLLQRQPSLRYQAKATMRAHTALQVLTLTPRKYGSGQKQQW